VNMMMFNIPAYAHMLMQDFLTAGGDLVIKEFENPRQFQELKEKTIIHATGYAARALLNDNSLVPVRGQTARLIPQPEVDYAISYDSQNVYTVPRRDGLIVQEWSAGDYGNENEVLIPKPLGLQSRRLRGCVRRWAKPFEPTNASEYSSFR
jgi:hypothetical protein